MTRLMVLGGGRHQLPLIQRAEERGIEVVLVDYLTNAPGRHVASHPVLGDATNQELALQVARKYDIDGVITTGTDIPIRSMAHVAATMNLPAYLDEHAALQATDKQAMFEVLESHGVRMAQRSLMTRGSTPQVTRFPVVIKPVDSQGQRGVSVATEEHDVDRGLRHAWDSSRTGLALIEEFLEGPELTANAWMHDGQTAMLLVNDRITFNPAPFLGIAFQHRFPSSAADPVTDEVARITESVALAYGMKYGPLYIQMIATDSGPTVVEAAARVGGGHESRLVFHLTGWRSDDALIDIALGDPPTLPPALPNGTHSLVNFVLGSAGTVTRISGPDLVPGIVEGSWYVRPGDLLDDVTNSLGRIGYFIAMSDSREGLMRESEDYYSTLEVLGDSNENLVRIPEPGALNLP